MGPFRVSRVIVRILQAPAKHTPSCAGRHVTGSWSGVQPLPCGNFAGGATDLRRERMLGHAGAGNFIDMIDLRAQRLQNLHQRLTQGVGPWYSWPTLLGLGGAWFARLEGCINPNMGRFLTARSGVAGDFIHKQNPLMLRHLFLCLGTIAAYVFRSPLGVGNGVLWVFGLAALSNLGMVFLGERLGMVRQAEFLSSIIGLSAWTVLSNLTGGATSPLSAGLGLEILLSMPKASPRRTLLIGLAAVTGLWGQEFVRQGESAWLALGWQSGFLIAIAAIALVTMRTWATRQKKLTRRLTDLHGRLRAAEVRMEGDRALRRVGANVACLAHGLLNAVHSLRGLARLMEGRLARTGYDAELLRQLEVATERIEELSQITLSPAARDGRAVIPCEDILAVARDAVVEIADSYPAIQWVMPSVGSLPPVKLPTGVLREVLLVLARNAAEASLEHGKVIISTNVENGSLQLTVSDEGQGIAGADLDSLFRPGFTTKPDGHGYGLFVSRGLLESHGGTLAVAERQPVGMVFTMSMPVWEA